MLNALRSAPDRSQLIDCPSGSVAVKVATVLVAFSSKVELLSSPVISGVFVDVIHVDCNWDGGIGRIVFIVVYVLAVADRNGH